MNKLMDYLLDICAIRAIITRDKKTGEVLGEYQELSSTWIKIPDDLINFSVLWNIASTHTKELNGELTGEYFYNAFCMTFTQIKENDKDILKITFMCAL